jgi:two-component system CheB/CheR fusion protein
MTLDTDEQAFDALLEYLRRTRGFDFTAYKRPSLVRRINQRLGHVGLQSYPDYTDYLEVRPDEFGHLFNTVLINVTGFFRDAQAWDYLRTDILPLIVSTKAPTEAIRCWCAGVASGEEAYSLAIVLAEHLGLDEYRQRVKIYATDADEEALAQARHAMYAERELAELPAPYLDKYFERAGGRFAFDKELRRSVIFGRHDLVQDAPISRIDLLICRNTLMYFNADVQTKVLARFYFALSETGFLFVGKAEMLFSHFNMFTPVEARRRVFAKVSKTNMRERLLILAQAGREDALHNLVNQARLRDTAFEADPVAHIVVDAAGTLTLASETARRMFDIDIGIKDFGRPLQDLELSYRPVELRSLIDRALETRGSVEHRGVEIRIGDLTRRHDVRVMPLVDPTGATIGTKIAFTDVSRYHALETELQTSRQELETAYEELQSTNEELQTATEELQSTVEELETTNEELQSTNEELETMNEALQSTNEELQTMNEELRQRNFDVSRLNLFLESILTSVQSAVIVVNGDLQVQAWNHHAEELWGLRRNETIGRNLMSLDFGFPIDDLTAAIRGSFNGEQQHREIVVPAVNCRGRHIECRVSCSPLRGPDGTSRGSILMIDEMPATAVNLP